MSDTVIIPAPDTPPAAESELDARTATTTSDAGGAQDGSAAAPEK